ncbi:MAG: dicarboxylate/amino acid:cation symporter [Ruminiclostridium sp.]|nr:dicarboxylate/amino acid:cation symporter [Ruminiclostridium sp.]
MKKKSLGLLPKLLIAIILGIAMGFAAQYMGSAGECIIRLGATYNSIFGNFINFCIPLIILGFVVPGIAELGSGAGKTLAVTVLVAYLSTIVAGSLAYAVDMGLFPHLVEAGMFTTSAENAEETVVSSFFNIEMPPIMGVMSALIMAFILGLGIALCRAGSLKGVFDDFGSIMTRVVERIIIPLLPIHVYGIFAKLAYAGTIVELMTSFLKVFVVVIALHIVILLLQYTAAGAVSHRNPFALLRTMLPAYTTAIGTQSSAATIPVTVDCAKRNGVQESIAQFVCPLCATIHLSGSTITLTSCSIAVMMMLGQGISFGQMFPFILMLGVTMVAAPGVPGGAVMAALGILESMLGFDADMQGLMIALYIAQDSFGTACNVTGDGAIAVFMDALSRRKAPTSEAG